MLLVVLEAKPTPLMWGLPPRGSNISMPYISHRKGNLYGKSSTQKCQLGKRYDMLVPPGYLLGEVFGTLKRS